MLKQGTTGQSTVQWWCYKHQSMVHGTNAKTTSKYIHVHGWTKSVQHISSVKVQFQILWKYFNAIRNEFNYRIKHEGSELRNEIQFHTLNVSRKLPVTNNTCKNSWIYSDNS